MKPSADELRGVLEASLAASCAWLDGLDSAPAGARRQGPNDVPGAAQLPLPEEGVGAAAALADLVQRAQDRATGSTGPRYFHYVVGGVTPAALGADWLASTLDQVASSASGSPLAIDLEELATRWLVELFDLGDPGGWTGSFTTGATMASFVGLGAARQRWGEALGVDVGADGLAGLPRPAVLTGGFVHASVAKALAMLGIGRRSVERFSLDNRGSLDLVALEKRLSALEGQGPAIVVATAGEVNAGDFDPIDALADLCAEHGAWLHVDGAFGLFARVSPRTRGLCAGVERADSVAVDAHKWLNVPYDSGIAFVRQRSLLAKTFRMVADYLPRAPGGAPPQRVPANLGPESSRRARALPVFATLLASGRAGVRAMVEEHLRLARYLAHQVRADPVLELLAEPKLNVVPFRVAPPGVRKRDLDGLNGEIARRVLAAGRVYVGTTRYRGRTAFRPAIANWRTQDTDVDALLTEIHRARGDLDAAPGAT